MQILPRDRREVIALYFTSSKQCGPHSGLFDDLPLRHQARLLCRLKLSKDEFGVLACYFDNLNWTILTTQRIVSLTDGSEAELNLGDVSKITFDAYEGQRRHGQDFKTKHDELLVANAKGLTLTLKLDPGLFLFAFYNMIYKSRRLLVGDWGTTYQQMRMLHGGARFHLSEVRRWCRRGLATLAGLVLGIYDH